MLFVGLSCLVPSSIVKAQENFLFLTADQFEHLTAGEQKIYIDALRRMIIHFEEQKDSNFQVTAVLKKYLWIQPLIPFAEAGVADDVSSSKNRSSDARIENAKISVSLVFLDSRISAAQDRKSAVMRADAKENFLDIYDRLKILSKKNLTDEQRKNFNSNLAGLREKYERLIQLSPELQSLRSEINQFTKARTSLKVSKPLVSASTSSSTLAATSAHSSSSPLCLYSGFVIRGTSCTPFKTLPENLYLSELGKSNFKCKSSNEILCNPLVFGFQADLSPYCTVRSRTASKNCQEISNNSENLNRLHKVWRNPANKKVFDEFQSSLKTLCSSEQKNLDVRNTCKIVVAQFNEKVKKEFPAQLAASSKESKTGRSLRTN